MSNDAPRPWKRLATRSEKDFHIFKTQTLEVLDPRTSAPYIRTVVMAPDWVNVVPLTPEGDVILVRQFRFGTWSTTLELPGGMVDPGEEAHTAAGRELEEETGYRPQRMSPLGISHPNPVIFNNRLHSFLAEGCSRVHHGKQDASEDIQVVVVQRSQLRKMVLDGTVTHALVLAALLYETWQKP